MKNFKWMTLGLLALSLTGCDGTTESPQGVISLAAKAVQKSNLRDLQSYLTGDALKQYGNAEGMKKLQDTLSPYAKFEFQNETLVKHVRGDQGYGFPGDVLRVYSEDIIGVTKAKASVKVYTASVTCTVYRERIAGVCTFPPIPGGPQTCQPDQYPEVQDCLVDNLQ